MAQDNPATLASKLAAYSIPEPNSGCFLWLGAINEQRGGYGILRWGTRVQGAHRWAWLDAGGVIPSGMEVCHSCDVRACVNPAHLFLDTHAGNMADQHRKGRQARGENHGSAKLTSASVAAIRTDERPLWEVADAHGVTSDNIRLIRQRKTWTHVQDAVA